MNIIKILIGVLVIVGTAILGLGWSIKSDIGDVDKSVAVNSQRMLTIEKQLESHGRIDR